MGSDHDVFQGGSWRIPAIYLHDWPDRYIHTNFDQPSKIDPTKLKRAGFIGAAAGWYMANLGPGDRPGLEAIYGRHLMERTAEMMAKSAQLPAGPDVATLARGHWKGEQVRLASLGRYLGTDTARLAAWEFMLDLRMTTGTLPWPEPVRGELARVYRRNPAIQGPMWAFGYSYLVDKLGAEEVGELKLPSHRGLWGGGRQYTYEALNFVNGRRSVAEIRDRLTAELGPVPVEQVLEYLEALEKIGVLERAD